MWIWMGNFISTATLPVMHACQTALHTGLYAQYYNMSVDGQSACMAVYWCNIQRRIHAINHAHACQPVSDDEYKRRS